MPNHITNRVTIVAGTERVREILDAIKRDEYGLGSLDFNKIIPMPPELQVECGSHSQRALEFYSLYVKHENDADPKPREKLIEEYQADQEMIDFGKQLYENKQKHGAADWYDWSIANWDTKWNSYGYENFPYREGNSEIMFYTAWSRPESVIVRLSELYPDVQFGHRWANEDIGCNVGELLYHDGDALEYDIPTPCTKEAYEMAADILDISLAEYDLYYNDELGTYEYKEKPNEILGGINMNNKRPYCPLIGADSNVFNLMGIAARTLKDHGLHDEAAEMKERITSSGSYDNALGIITEYVNPVSATDNALAEDCDEEQDCDGMNMQ